MILLFICYWSWAHWQAHKFTLTILVKVLYSHFIHILRPLKTKYVFSSEFAAQSKKKLLKKKKEIQSHIVTNMFSQWHQNFYWSIFFLGTGSIFRISFTMAKKPLEGCSSLFRTSKRKKSETKQTTDHDIVWLSDYLLIQVQFGWMIWRDEPVGSFSCSRSKRITTHLHNNDWTYLSMCFCTD